MYLFEHIQRAHLYDWPYPHLVIQNALESDLAQHLTDQFHCETPSHTWKEVIDKNIKHKKEEIVSHLDSLFELPETDYLMTEANFSEFNFENQPELVKDWHVDGPTKKYQILYFLGDCTFGGEHEMLEESTNMKKVIPFTHNMVLAWHNNYNEPEAIHRFYTGQGQRYTFNIPVCYVNSKDIL